MRLNFVTYFVTSHYNFKDWQSIYIWFKATKRKTCYSIYIRYPCGNIQGSFILHLYHVLCAWVYVIEIQIAVSYIYTCHVQVSTALSRINYFTKILFDMEARIVIRNTSTRYIIQTHFLWRLTLYNCELIYLAYSRRVNKISC